MQLSTFSRHQILGMVQMKQRYRIWPVESFRDRKDFAQPNVAIHRHLVGRNLYERAIILMERLNELLPGV